MPRPPRKLWELRPEDAPPSWLMHREPMLHGLADNPLFRLILFRRHRGDRMRVSILGYLVLGLGGATLATFGALTWPMAAWLLATWSILSLEVVDRPGWVNPKVNGLGGMTALPRQAMADLHLAGFEAESMSLALWASTLSRSLLLLWGVLALVGAATCWGRLLGLTQSGDVSPTAWLWTVPLAYLSFRGCARMLTPCDTLPRCLSLLENARIQWLRGHQPWKYFVQSSITVTRHLLLIGALLLVAALVGSRFGEVYGRLPFDMSRPSNLLVGGFVSMLAGALAGFLYRPMLEHRRDECLRQSAELLRWLLENERSATQDGNAARPRSGAQGLASAKA